MTHQAWTAILVTAVLVFAVSVVAFAQPSDKTDGTGRATGYWEAYEKAQTPYAPYTVDKTDGTGRATGYWEAYEKAQTPYAPYTVDKTDGTGRADGLLGGLREGLHSLALSGAADCSWLKQERVATRVATLAPETRERPGSVARDTATHPLFVWWAMVDGLVLHRD